MKLTITTEVWPLAATFTIAHGSKDTADTVYITLEKDGHIGRAEAEPYSRYGQSTGSVAAQVEELRAVIEAGVSRDQLEGLLPPGSARNLLDCALWDLEAKTTGIRVWDTLGINTSTRIQTAYTIPYNPADVMGAGAKQHAHRPLLKIKLAGPDDLDRLKAVRDGAPDATLVVDANEGWKLADFERIAPHLGNEGVVMVEQPLPAGQDKDLKAGAFPFDLCADESCHDRASLVDIVGHYDMLNIKLDKTGGLTEALALKAAARRHGLKVMVGCMVGTSLAMAPGMAVAHDADIVDLDGPLLLAKDRDHGIGFDGSMMAFPEAELWG